MYQNQFDNLIAWSNNGPENIAKASFEGDAQVQDMFGIDLDNFSYVDAEDDNTGQALVLGAEKTFNWSVGKQFDKWYVGAQLHAPMIKLLSY